MTQAEQTRLAAYGAAMGTFRRLSTIGGGARLPRAVCWCIVLLMCGASTARAQTHWVTAWSASVQGPYPTGNATVQPDLKLVFPSAERGARNQSFRLIVRPDVWGGRMRVRLSNALGTKPVTFDDVYVGLQMSGSAIVKGSNVPVRFGGKTAVTVAAGGDAWSDSVTLPFVGANASVALAGRKLAVSFHVQDESGPMTWHAKALTTSYITLPDAGSKGREEAEQAFPAGTTSWYFLDALDMQMPATSRTIVAFGDSITDGTASTLNGDDRWPDVLSRRLHAQFEDRVSIVNAGIGGNRVAGPAEYTPARPFSGGPAAAQRLDRDVLSLSSIAAVIWLEGINDLNVAANTSVETVEEAMRDVVGRLRAKGVRVFGATLTSAVGNGQPGDSAAREVNRQALNAFIRTAGLFDGVIDFDNATIDPVTGAMRDAFIPNSTDGGPGDHLHPNRLGYAAMAGAVDLTQLVRW